MDSFGGDEDDHESAESSDNDQDGLAEEPDDEDMDENGARDMDGEAEGENEEENENDDDEQDQDDLQNPLREGTHPGQKPISASQVSLLSGTSGPTLGASGLHGPVLAPTPHPNLATLLTSPSSTQESSPSNGFSVDLPKLRPEVMKASVYDIVPTIAAPHSTSINSVTATPDLRWVFSGGADGYIRKFNWPDTANGKSMLTVAQRHPFVDSVTKAGVLMSYWENNEESSGKPADDGSLMSSVYSLAVHRDGLWLLSGLESGGINLQSIRHDEGKHIACLRGHTSAVSVLKLASDEASLLSGSWDKTIADWDLNTGKIIRKFEGSGGQISALETRPFSTLPVPEVSELVLEADGTFSTDSEVRPRLNATTDDGTDAKIDQTSLDNAATEDVGSPNDSLFEDGDDIVPRFEDNDNDNGAPEAPSGGNFVDDEDDEFSRAIADGIREQVEEQAHEKSSHDTEGDIQMTDPTNPSPIVVAGEQQNSQEALGIESPSKPAVSQEFLTVSNTFVNGIPHADESSAKGDFDSSAPRETFPSSSDAIFLAAVFDGTLRVWDKRQSTPIAKVTPQNVPPWCMNACWSPDGNFIYAGRRNGTVDEYSLHKGLRGVERNFKLPNGSGPVSAVRAMPNGRHLICASYDILRLYDLQQQQIFKHATVPFLIVPGHRTGVVSHLYIDPTCRYLITAAGNRGWEGSSTEVLLGYEIGVPK